MPKHRSIFGRVVLCLLVCVLLCGIVSSELPELLSLTDNTSNDFTFRKTSGQECVSTLGAAVHKSVPLDMKNSECGPCTKLCAYACGYGNSLLRSVRPAFCASQIEVCSPHHVQLLSQWCKFFGLLTCTLCLIRGTPVCSSMGKHRGRSTR